MKKILFIILCAFVAFGAANAQTVVDPSAFTESTNPQESNFEFYSRKGGTNRRATFNSVRKRMLPFVFQGSAPAVPASSGNVSNLGYFFTATDGDVYYVDGLGFSILIRDGQALNNSTIFAGDVTGAASNLQIGASAVGTAEIAAGSVAASDLSAMGATTGQLMQYNGSAWVPVDARSVGSISTENAQSGTTYTLVLADAGKLVTLTNASAITLTVPTNASVAYSTGQRIDLAQLGAGQVTVAAAGGVTVNGTPGLKLRAQYSAASLVKLGTNTWLLVGDLSL
jgi:hypothetical protein